MLFLLFPFLPLNSLIWSGDVKCKLPLEICLVLFGRYPSGYILFSSSSERLQQINFQSREIVRGEAEWGRINFAFKAASGLLDLAS